jgi:DNA-binding protein YbaB
MHDEAKPSLDSLYAKAELVEQRLLRQRRQLSEQILTARDEWGLVEVRVNGHGEVVEVAVDAALAPHVEPIDLAESMLEAARAAQQQATAVRRGGADPTRKRSNHAGQRHPK